MRSNNKAPVISLIKTKIAGKQALEFSVVAKDPDGHLVSYEWDFGDGHISTLRSPLHTYEKKGIYLISCTVEDNENVCLTSWRYFKIN